MQAIIDIRALLSKRGAKRERFLSIDWAARPRLIRAYRALIPVRLLARGIMSRLAHCVHQIYQRIARPKPATKRTVLIVARNGLSVVHGQALLECLSSERDLSFAITGPRQLVKQLRNRPSPALQGIRIMGFARALLERWDLLCFPHHHHAALFHPSIPRLYTQHGLETGKRIVGGTGYTYGWKAMRDRRHCAYSGFLSVTAGEKEMAWDDRFGPQITERLLLSTEPVALKLLEALKKHRPERKSRTDLLIISTWGPRGLLSKWGNALLSHVLRLPYRFDVRVSLHPRCYDQTESEHWIRTLTERGIPIVPPTPDEWIPALLRTDVAIGDRSALTLYYSLLGRPMVFLEGRPDDVQPGSPLFDIYPCCPILDLSQDLAEQLDAAVSSNVGELVRERIKECYPHVGDRERMLNQVRRLMVAGGAPL